MTKPTEQPTSARSTRGLRYWFAQRDLRYVAKRVVRLASRYGVSPGKAMDRTRRLVDLLDRHGCAPTFATPGSVVAGHPDFMRELVAAGVELAVHAYDHVDFRSLSRERALSQLQHAAGAFADAGVPHCGFRCPYLSFDHEMKGFVPEGLFAYSSNEAVWWDVVPPRAGAHRDVTFAQLGEFYRATPAEKSLVLPRFIDGLLEIPVSLPDDLQLLDGLGGDEERVAEVWLALLHASHARSSVFTVLMHPETFDLCSRAYATVLDEARSATPAVWIARLVDVSDWWHELRGSSVKIEGSTVLFDCPERATLVGRGLREPADLSWHAGYTRLSGRTIELGDRVPLIGADAAVLPSHVERLRELGYGVVQGPGSERCAVRLPADALGVDADGAEVVAYVEAQPGPLVRVWHWPAGFASALCITGDLDALTLGDFARRIVRL